MARLSTWAQSVSDDVDGICEAYLAKTVRLTERLRRRFERGELRAARGSEASCESPEVEIEEACAKAFGIYDGPLCSVMALLAVSPHAAAFADAGMAPRDWAAAAAAWDVIALARSSDYYSPAPDESEEPEPRDRAIQLRSPHRAA